MEIGSDIMEEKVPNYIVTNTELNMNPNSVTLAQENNKITVIDASLLKIICDLFSRIRKLNSNSISNQNLEEVAAKARVPAKTKVLKQEDNSNGGGFVATTVLTIMGTLLVATLIFLFVGNIILG